MANGDGTFQNVILNSFQNLEEILKQVQHDNPDLPHSLFLRFTQDKLLGIEGFRVTKVRSGGFWMKFNTIVSV